MKDAFGLKNGFNLGLLCASVVLCTAPPASHAGLRADDVKPGSRQEAIAADAKAYSSASGLTLAQAHIRMRTADKMGEPLAHIRKKFSERLAGIYFEDAPRFKVLVRLTGHKPVAPTSLKLDGVKVPVEFITGARSTLDVLVTSISAKTQDLVTMVPGLDGVGTDERTGEIVLNVFAEGSDRKALATLNPDVEQLLGHPARIDFEDYPAMDADVRGGAKITSSSGSYCTSGFVVKNTSGTTGVLTAAHCEGMNTYYNPSGTTHPLDIAVGEVKDSDQDVEVHTSSAVERAEFYADSTAAARTLTGRRLRSSTAVGDQVCHRGETTGYSCGTVELTNYAPTYAGACGTQTCAPVWVKVQGGPTTACYQGDSGGPVFASQTAFGLLKGTAASGAGAGQCSYFIYMSTDYISSGWSLLYGP